METPIRIAFICTGNACRSQMAEAIMRQVLGPRFQVVSAGSNPAGYIHPLAIATLKAMDVPMEGQYSKSWDEIARDRLDIVITLCDHAAGQACPQWIGQPTTAHWSLPDPSFHPGTEGDRSAFARGVAETIRRRAEQLARLPLETMSPDELRAELQRLATVW
ncbi:MAG TPA: arsenate reductase ArsC [Phycisphaerae bacterium]|jgi:arsenate reductase|nr:arsenate reductase ArsC [Phycisphaerae bacterium]HOB75057.1 arsenate reductase ArsC [Phycisphaerae bacterium]HOJ54808.1 arsenate reductase ArsC [Phycisphaerae bacterium]HOL26914.1 arsenate reductase ArsC [Phycisphaerae bacterium]HPP20869.1 arsenate reductase ArsC [Phycisphaerae bacterium]